MIKIIKNPSKEWMKGTKLNGRYIFMCDDFSGKTAYAKIGVKALIGYIIMRIKYKKREL